MNCNCNRINLGGSKFTAILSLMLATMWIGGCDSKDRAPGQTAAKVNGDEVTVHQINSELQRQTAGTLPQGTDVDSVNKRILDGLIDQTLLVQQAKENKLDRDPTVLQQLEAARRQILAQAFIDRQAAASPPSQDEIKEFYAKHPDLFENRRIYAFREFIFERSKFDDQLRDQLNKAKSPAELGRVLNAAGIRFRETNSRRPAESLPLDALPRIAKMAKGDTVAFTDQNLTNVLLLLDYNEQSVPLDRATPLIQQYLVNAKKREIAQSKVKELREKGKIEYLGKFADTETASKPAQAKPAEPSSPAGDAHVEKGLSGLRR